MHPGVRGVKLTFKVPIRCSLYISAPKPSGILRLMLHQPHGLQHCCAGVQLVLLELEECALTQLGSVRVEGLLPLCRAIEKTPVSKS